MGRRRRKKDDPLDMLIDIAPSIILLIFLYLWFKFGNLTIPVVVVGLITILILSSAFFFYRKHKRKLMESGIGLIDEMSGAVFEELLMEHFKRLGYKARMTARTADYGADLILEKEDERIVVQAKRWKQNVGIAAIQQVVGAIKHYQADKGMVISNSYFTMNAENLASSNNIELWDRDKLVRFLSKARGKQLSEGIIDRSQIDGEICPRCGNRMVLRSGKYGKFWGCETFPRCRFTKPCDD